MTTDIQLWAGLSLAELHRIKRIEYQFTHAYIRLKEEFDKNKYLYAVGEFDAAIKSAIERRLIEIEVVDDFLLHTKMITVYPYGEAPEGVETIKADAD